MFGPGSTRPWLRWLLLGSLLSRVTQTRAASASFGGMARSSNITVAFVDAGARLGTTSTF